VSDPPDSLPDPTRGILDVDELRTLRRINPAYLYSQLDLLRQRFLFGVARCEGWGGAFRILINRNISLHLVHGFDAEMPDTASLPQFCAMPDEDRADQIVLSRQETSDGDEILGLIFYVDPYEFDVLLRESDQVAENYPEWDILPDAYYLGSDLVGWLTRVVLEHPQIMAERKFDFRLGLPGLVPDPLEDNQDYTAQDLITPESEQEQEADEEGEDGTGEERDDDDFDPPMSGMRSHGVEFG
jgi:hypothetical protein